MSRTSLVGAGVVLLAVVALAGRREVDMPVAAGAMATAHAHQPVSTWERVSPNGSVSQLILTRPGTIYARATDGIWRSDDDGTTWRRLDTPTIDLDINRGPWHGFGLAYDPTQPDHLWLGGTYPDSRSLASRDGGDTWLDTGLAEPEAVRYLAFHPWGRSLYATTERGVWRLRPDD